MQLGGLSVNLNHLTSNLVANQAKQHAEATAALGVPPADRGDVAVAGENASVQDTGNTVADENMNPEATRNYKEPPANKPAVKYTKKAQSIDEIQ